MQHSFTRKDIWRLMQHNTNENFGKYEGTVLQHWESHFSPKLLLMAVLLHCRAKLVPQISSSCPCLAVIALKTRLGDTWETLLQLSVLKGALQKKENSFLNGLFKQDVEEQFYTKRGRFGLDMKKKLFTVRRVRHWHKLPRRCRCPIHESQAGWDLKQSDLVGGIPACVRGIGTR